MNTSIKLNDILHLQENDFYKYKLHIAKANEVGTQPLDVFLKNFDEWIEWNKYRGWDYTNDKPQKDDFNRKYIFTLIKDYTRDNKYIFGGVFEVIERINDEYGYIVKHSEQYKALTGRLIVNFDFKQRGRSFKFENWIEQIEVAEILEKPYGGINFTGYENVLLTFKMLELLVKNQKQDWITALGNVKGIYVIMDKSNGKKYIGSAYGNAGIWARWICYATTGHGYNDGLMEIINEKGIEYARENFQFSILQTLSMGADDNFIISRESFWKEVLLSRGDFGYNKN